MDQKLIAGALALLIIQIALLTTDLDIYPGRDNIKGVPPQEIGRILRKKLNVKKRSQGSIVWEDSEKLDRLKKYDSVLTLENSSAQLELKDNIKIELQENTLIVLEPQDTQSNESLRIRFSRGHMSTKSREKNIQLISKSWDIAATPGTALSLKGLDDDHFEIEVTSGSARLENNKNPEENHIIQTGRRLTFSETKVDKVETISTNLNFLLKSETRVYTHALPIKQFIQWEGSAQKLRVVNPDHSITYFNLAENQKNAVINFNVGTHHLSLEGNGTISKEFTFRVLPAPRIRYTSPLPRDRFLINNEILTSWLPLEGAIQYEVELTNENTERQIIASKSTLTKIQPEIEGQIQMRVFGEDDMGFRMPPHYSQTLYILQNALAPPKLQSPNTRAPASPKPEKKSAPKFDDKNNSGKSAHNWRWKLIQLLFDTAIAEDAPTQKQYIVLSWYPVPGADYYNIEISSDPGFLNPEVTEKIDKEIFNWRNFTHKVYYWRVAAASNSGQMGLFSETAKLDLTNIANLESSELAPGIKLVTPEEVRIKPIIKMPEENVKPEPKPEVIADIKNEKPSMWAFTTDLNLHYLNYSLKKNFSATLSGFADFSFAAAATVTKSNQDKYLFSAGVTQTKWTPESKSTLPFQKELSTTAYSFLGLYEKSGRDFSYGLAVESHPILQRTALEELTKTDVLMYGPAIGYYTKIADDIWFQSTGALLTGDRVSSIAASSAINYQFSSSRWSPYLGGDFNFDMFFGSDSMSGFYLTTGLHLGLNW